MITQVVDELRSVTERAINLLEKFEEQSETLKRAKLGMLPDGTPVEDMLEELHMLKLDHQIVCGVLQTIRHHALSCNSTTAYKAIKAIRTESGRLR